ncbi:MAG: DUF2062 domain-containing protein [Pseudomonadota bacterium]
MAGTISRLYEQVLKSGSCPRKIALGFALGVFIAFTPTMGIQTVVSVFAAACLEWNTVAAALGVQVTNVVTAPAIYTFTYLVGASLMPVDTLLIFDSRMTMESFLSMLKQAPAVFSALAIGGIVVGVPASIAGYYLVYKVVSRYKGRIQKIAGQEDNNP